MKRYVLILLLVAFLAACAQPTPEASPTPTHTYPPTNTSTPTFAPVTPVAQGTPLPEHGGVITEGNIHRLTLLSRWGEGNPGDIAYTPDGEYFLVSMTTGLYIYDANDFSFIHYMDTQTAVRDLAISPDGRVIAIVVKDEVMLYQVGDWRLLLTIQVDAIRVYFSPDSQMLVLDVISDLVDIQVRDVESGEIIESLEYSETVNPVGISPRGYVLATGSYSTIIWSLDGTIVDQDVPHIMGYVSFSPDGEFLVQAYEYRLHIWRVLANGQIVYHREIDLREFDYPSISNVVVSPDGNMLAASLDGGIGVWDLSTGDQDIYIPAKYRNTYYDGLAWSVDSRTIAGASSDSGVEIWSIDTGEKLASINTHPGTFSSLVWSPDGQLLAVGAEEGVAYLFNAQNGEVNEHFDSWSGINSLAFSPDGDSLAIGYRSQSAIFWNIDGTYISTLIGFGYGSTDVIYSSDGSFFAAIVPESWDSPDQVRFWNTSDWHVEKTFSLGNQNDFMITGFALAPEQDTCAISYMDMRGYHTDYIQIFSIEDGKKIAKLQPRRNNSSIAYSPNGVFLATAEDEFNVTYPRLSVWQTSDWKLLYQKDIVAGQRIGVNWNKQDSLSWSPDSKLIAVGVRDGSVQIFRAIDGEKLITLTGHTMWATGVSFSPDGRLLASVSLDGTVLVWGIR